MEPKIISRELKTTTTINNKETIKYDDGSTKITTESKIYLDNIEIPGLGHKKVEYRDPNGKINRHIETPDGFNYDEISQEEHTDTEYDTESDTESESDKGSDTEYDKESDKESDSKKCYPRRWHQLFSDFIFRKSRNGK